MQTKAQRRAALQDRLDVLQLQWEAAADPDEGDDAVADKLSREMDRVERDLWAMDASPRERQGMGCGDV